MQFIEAAQRVKKAGCDGVELHAAHGYLIQQFLSPNTNRRTDEYGGSLENRMRFLTEIIDGIRITCGRDFPIVVRLSVDEMYDRIGQPGKGYGLEEGHCKWPKFCLTSALTPDVSSACYDTFKLLAGAGNFPLRLAQAPGPGSQRSGEHSCDCRQFDSHPGASGRTACIQGIQDFVAWPPPDC